jgi:hypothetical protein
VPTGELGIEEMSARAKVEVVEVVKPVKALLISVK